MTLRAETVIKRRLELQIALRYETRLAEMRARIAELERQLAERGAAPAEPQPPPQPERCACSCVWCSMSREAAGYCQQHDSVPERAA